jgi:hypothetical protein
MYYVNKEIVEQNLSLSILQASICYDSIDGLLSAYSSNQEKSLVKAQNKVALLQFLPINNTLLLKDKKEKKAKVKYIMPTTWKDTFKLIKLIWQTRQLELM